MNASAATLREEWARDVEQLRECRNLQRQIAELGIALPILDLLVARGALRRALALKQLRPGYLFPGDPRTRHDESAVLACACRAGLVAEADLAAAQESLRAVAALGVPITLASVLIARGRIKASDLEKCDERLDRPADSASRTTP